MPGQDDGDPDADFSGRAQDPAGPVKTSVRISRGRLETSADSSKIVRCGQTHLCNFRASASIDLRVLKVMRCFRQRCQTLTQK